MSDTLTAVDELFASPDFDDRLTEWQQAKNAHDYQGLLLQDHLVQIYGGDGYDEDRDPSRISESVSYDLEIEAEEFEDLHFHDNKALRLHRLRSSAEDQTHGHATVICGGHPEPFDVQVRLVTAPVRARLYGRNQAYKYFAVSDGSRR